MKGFAPTHVPVLRVLGEVWGPDRFIVIGAAAVGYHIGMTWRGTLDLDLSVAAGIDRYEADLKDLGWRQDEKAPQRWYSREGLIVDVLDVRVKVNGELDRSSTRTTNFDLAVW